MNTRKLTVIACEPFRSGVTNGRAWTIHRVEALDEQGNLIDEDLISFDELPENEVAEYTVERRERTFKRRTYVSFCLSLPKAAKQSLPRVPAGRYAVEINGNVELYRVWRGTRDPSYQQVYAVSGTEKGERVFDKVEAAAVKAIAEDPGAAAIRFGHCTSHCSRCGIKLEVNVVRLVGVGETCAKHWYGDEAREMFHDHAMILRQAGIDPRGTNADLSVLEQVAA